MSPSNSSSSNVRGWLAAVVAVGALGAAAWATSSKWLPQSGESAGSAEHGEHGHEHGEEHGHSHAGEAAASSVKLSAKALKNIGFEPLTIKVGEFEKKITLPAMVIEQAGRNQIHVTAPLTGAVAEVLIVPGEAVEPDSAMFRLRLTHEDVVTAQRDFLQNVENLAVVDREIARLEALGEGVIAGKRVLEQKYEKQKLDASLLASEQALLMHGLTAEQVAEIRETRKLLKSLTIRAPGHDHESGSSCGDDHLFHVQRIAVSPGEQVQAGGELCVLADHCELMVEGRAFEDDAAQLREAMKEGWDVSATLVGGKGKTERIDGLRLMYLADKIDPNTRAFNFYLRLPNRIVLEQKSPTGHRYLEWQYKPGQRLELSVPVERWTERIVLPVDAVVEEGAEMYVYRQNGNLFERVPVHVVYRDRSSVVIANDGAVFPGDVVAGSGAYQIHLALKNQSGGAIDPHAGHNH